VRRLLSIVAVVLAAGVVGCSAGAPKEKEPSRLSVFLADDVTDGQRDAIQQKLTAMASIRDVTLETKQQAWEEFQQQFKDSPDLLAQTRPDSLPATFRATVTDSALAEAVKAVIGPTAGVEDVAVNLGGTKVPKTEGLVVQVSGDATDGQRAGIERAIQAVPGARPARFETSAAAYARLKAACHDQPGLAGALDPGAVSASYRFVIPVSSVGSLPQLSLGKVDGVLDVLTVPASTL
jgi:cell division protein FtsX